MYKYKKRKIRHIYQQNIIISTIFGTDISNNINVKYRVNYIKMLKKYSVFNYR